MIKIKAAYIGNSNEAFIENKFQDGINVIYSLDNDRGKTILMQSIMYTLGAIPTFPESFHYKDYIYILDLDVNGRKVSILRDHNSFAVQEEGSIDLFDSVKSYTSFWREELNLPPIVKDDHAVPIGLELYTQMFFIGQDDISSAKIKAGQFNKQDFTEMLYTIAGLGKKGLSPSEAEALKHKKNELREYIKTLEKETKALKLRGTALCQISTTVDTRNMAELFNDLDTIQHEISGLQKSRSRILARLTKDKIVLDELRSLQSEVKTGQLVCLSCGKQTIGYRMAGASAIFDVTSSEMRNQIIHSLQNRIEDNTNKIDTLTDELRTAQKRFSDLLSENREFNLADVLAYKSEYLDEKELDDKIQASRYELEDITSQLEFSQQITKKLSLRRNDFMNELLSKMSHARCVISGNKNEPYYEKLFSTNANVFSGSDRTIYFVSRCYALTKQIRHGMPLLIDSFRADDLSSEREDRLIDLLEEVDNQIILTTTIKKEEHGISKYEKDSRVHAIDYSSHKLNKLLNSSYNGDFAQKAAEFGIVFF